MAPDLAGFAGGVLTGLIAGFFSGLLGVSSGGILVPVIHAVLGADQHVAQGLSLVAQVPPTSLTGVAEYKRGGAGVPLRWIIVLALGFLLGGVAGAAAAGALPGIVLKWLFVAYLLLLALLAGRRGRRTQKHETVAVRSDVPAAGLIAVGAVGGFSSGLLGIGGGLATTVLTIAFLRMQRRRAQAMSLALGVLPVTAPAAWVYLQQGGPLPLWAAAGIVMGLLFGTFAGARAANHIPEELLHRTMLVLICGMAAYMAVK